MRIAAAAIGGVLFGAVLTIVAIRHIVGDTINTVIRDLNKDAAG